MRATELQAVVAWHGADRTAMLTLTVAHGLGDGLREVVRGVARAWRRVARGAPWRRFVAAVGLVGHVRAAEVTHGWQNGWHPHLHVLLLVRDLEVLDEWRAWLSERWRAAVVAELGADAEPSAERGARLTAATDGTYLSKMGTAALELTDAAGAKGAKNGNRDPWQIAASALARGDGPHAGDGALWRVYAEGMVGSRQLTWSSGLKMQAHMQEVLDEEAARRDGEGDGAVMLAWVNHVDWPLVHRAIDGENWIVYRALEGGQVAVDAQLERWRAQRERGEPMRCDEKLEDLTRALRSAS